MTVRGNKLMIETVVMETSFVLQEFASFLFEITEPISRMLQQNMRATYL